MARRILAGTIGMTLIGCSGTVPVPSDNETINNEPLATVEQAFSNNVTTKNCSAAEGALFTKGTGLVSSYVDNTIRQPQWDACLADSFMSQVANGYSVQDIAAKYRLPVSTTITCASALSSGAQGYYDWWGYVSAAGFAVPNQEAMTLSTQLLNDSQPQVYYYDYNGNRVMYPRREGIASVVVHELAHNYGNEHSHDFDTEYNWTVPERAASCVANGNVLPYGQSRTLGMPGEVEMGPIGRTVNASPFEFYGMGDQYVSAIAPGSRSAPPNNKYVDYFGVQFTSAATGTTSLGSPDHVGADCYNSGTALCVPPTPDKYPWISCGANEVPIGVYGDLTGTPNQPPPSSQYVNRLGLICFNYLTGVVQDSAVSAGMSGWSFRQQCPSNQLIRGIRGRVGGQLSQIQLVCDYWGKSFSADHVPHAVGKVYGSTSNVKFSVRCSGNGALSALNGRADSTIRRLGATCTPTGGTLPVTPQGPEHPATPYVGSMPDSYHKSPGAKFGRAHCGNGELMVGIQVRSSGSAVNGLSPICANADQWDNSSSGDYNLNVWNGSKSGTVYDQYCPDYQFMVGYDVWSGSSVNGIQIVCADMR